MRQDGVHPHKQISDKSFCARFLRNVLHNIIEVAAEGNARRHSFYAQHFVERFWKGSAEGFCQTFRVKSHHDECDIALEFPVRRNDSQKTNEKKRKTAKTATKKRRKKILVCWSWSAGSGLLVLQIALKWTAKNSRKIPDVLFFQKSTVWKFSGISGYLLEPSGPQFFPQKNWYIQHFQETEKIISILSTKIFWN